MDYLTIESTDESLESWKNSAFLSETLRGLLADSNLILVPELVSLDEREIRCFPEGTGDLADFLRVAAPESLKWEICIDDEEYQEYARHADVQIIAGVVTTVIIAPLFVNLLAEYIKRRCGIGMKNATVKASITVKDEASGKSLAFKYDGPAETFEKTMLEGLNSKIAKQEIATSEIPQTLPLIEAPEIDEANDAG